MGSFLKLLIVTDVHSDCQLLWDNLNKAIEKSHEGGNWHDQALIPIGPMGVCCEIKNAWYEELIEELRKVPFKHPECVVVISNHENYDLGTWRIDRLNGRKTSFSCEDEQFEKFMETTI
jgi:hypothetical protein